MEGTAERREDGDLLGDLGDAGLALGDGRDGKVRPPDGGTPPHAHAKHVVEEKGRARGYVAEKLGGRGSMDV